MDSSIQIAMYQTIQEGKALIKISEEKKISKKLPVFYNPVMKFNRDVSVLILKTISDKKLRVALPLAGTGVRGIRFLKELSQSKIKSVSFNDYNPNFKKILSENLKLNNIKSNEQVQIFNKDANLFLLESSGFDYIDIDPFGSPNPFLDSAVRRIARNGILAVTATDIASLAGTYPAKCKRAYWAVPKRDCCMHETGLRILIRKCQLIGAQHEKALIPLFSFYKDHYFRVFFRCTKSNNEIDQIIKQHKTITSKLSDFSFPLADVGEKKSRQAPTKETIGPLWTGPLFDSNLIKKIKLNKIENDNKELIKFIKIIKEESKISSVGFYEMNDMIRKLKIKPIKKTDLINKLKKSKYNASETHFSPSGIKTDADLGRLIGALK